MSEIRWTRQGDYWSADYRVIFNGDECKITEVGIITNKDLGYKINRIIHYNERIIAIKLQSKQSEIFIVQVYMPTFSDQDEEIE